VYTPLHTVKGGIQDRGLKKILYKEKREAYQRMNVHSVSCEI
jgi:hypothetical protein